MYLAALTAVISSAMERYKSWDFSRRSLTFCVYKPDVQWVIQDEKTSHTRDISDILCARSARNYLTNRLQFASSKQVYKAGYESLNFSPTNKAFECVSHPPIFYTECCNTSRLLRDISKYQEVANKATVVARKVHVKSYATTGASAKLSVHTPYW